MIELDHSKLPPEAPELLKSTRIVMVSEKDLSNVSVRFPSLHSLKDFMTEDGSLNNQLPAMDDKYYFEPETLTASEVLSRRVPPEEISERSKVWSFWLEAEQGVIKRRRFGSPVKKKMEIEGGGALEDETSTEEEEEAQPNVVVVKNQRSGRTKKAKHQVQRDKGRMVKASVARLMPAERYKLAEENMLKVLKPRGANAGKPIKRTGLRNEAQKLIGGTGLLKHMAGKVTAGGADGLKELWDEIYNLKKREMEPKQPDQALAMVTTTSNPLRTCMDWNQAYSLGIQQKDKYAQVLAVSRSSKFEEHMQQPSQTLYGMEDEIKELKSTTEAPGAALMYYSEAAVPQPNVNARGVKDDKPTKLETLRSGCRISRPPGTFLWPNMNMSMSLHQANLVLPRSLRGLNHGSSSGSLVKPFAERSPVNRSPLLCNVTYPPSRSPAFSRVPSEAKDANTRFSPTNLGDVRAKRCDDMRNVKGTTAVARIGHYYIHMASDQRQVSPGGFVLNDRLQKLYSIDLEYSDIVSVGVGVSVICGEFIATASTMNEAVFRRSAHALRVYLAARVIMACIDHWEDTHAPNICNEEFLLSGYSDGQPLVCRVRRRALGGISYGGAVGYAVAIGGGTVEAFQFIQTHEQLPELQAVVQGSVVVASLVNRSTGGHAHSVLLPLHGNRAAIHWQPLSSVLQLLERDWGYYQPYLWNSLFFVCLDLVYTEQSEARLSDFLGIEFPGSRTHIISCQTEIIRLITFSDYVDRIAAWVEVRNGYDWHDGGELFRLTFYEPTAGIVTGLREIEQNLIQID